MEEKRLEREMEEKRLEREMEEKRLEIEAKLQSEKLAAPHWSLKSYNWKELGWNAKTSKLLQKCSRQHRVRLVKKTWLR